MAEPVSSIVTLATVSLQIIRETTRFIQESKVVDNLVKKLARNLQNLSRLIEIVDLANSEAQPTEDDPFVQDTLAQCRKLLENVQSVVEPLVCQKSETIWEKAVLNFRVRHSRPIIEGAILDIRELVGQMNVAINCWTLYTSLYLLPSPELTADLFIE